MDISTAKVEILKFLLINQHVLDTINLKITQINLYNYLLIYLSIFSLPQLFYQIGIVYINIPHYLMITFLYQ